MRSGAALVLSLLFVGLPGCTERPPVDGGVEVEVPPLPMLHESIPVVTLLPGNPWAILRFRVGPEAWQAEANGGYSLTFTSASDNLQAAADGALLFRTEGSELTLLNVFRGAAGWSFSASGGAPRDDSYLVVFLANDLLREATIRIDLDGARERKTTNAGLMEQGDGARVSYYRESGGEVQTHDVDVKDSRPPGPAAQVKGSGTVDLLSTFDLADLGLVYCAAVIEGSPRLGQWNASVVLDEQGFVGHGDLAQAAGTPAVAFLDVGQTGSCGLRYTVESLDALPTIDYLLLAAPMRHIERLLELSAVHDGLARE